MWGFNANRANPCGDDRLNNARRETSDALLGVVVVAAGRSTRMGGTDKTFVEVLGTPLIAHTLRRIAQSDVVDRIVLVVSADAVPDGEAIVQDLDIPKIAAVCAGGARRQDSVLAGLVAMGDRRWVAIHDGARPCVTPDMLSRALHEVRGSGAAIAAVPVKDTIKVVGEGQVISATPTGRLCGRRKLRRHLIIKRCWTPTAPRMSNTLMTRPWSRLPATGSRFSGVITTI